jgi:diguanylate cyclase (GGDEF)-like protein
LQLLCGGVGVFLLTDILYGMMVLAGTYTSGSPLDTGYVVAYGLLGAAALHPSAPRLTAGESGSSQRLTRGRLAALMAASLLAPIVDVAADDSNLHMITLGVSAVLFLLVITRMALLLRALEKATAQGAVLEDELRHQALHDPLTGLANRVLFTDRVEQTLHRMARQPLRAAVLFLDLDDFKTVNDSLGHGAGDEFLAAVSARVGSCIRPVDTAARLGGDEFGVLLEGLDGVAAAVDVAERIIERCREPVEIQGRHVTGSVSVGVVMAEPHQDAEVVLRNADLAMYRAKHRGKDQWELYKSGMHLQVLARLDLKADLQSALSARQFELWYQPVVRLKDGTIIGAEALVRWRHPRRGLVSPEEFVPLAEETGAVVPLGRWVLEESCARASGWQQRYPDEPFTISVNLSPVQLREPGFVDDVAAAVADAGLNPHRLLLELTEGVFVRDAEPTLEALRELRELGVRIAIDDFGTGYSSLSYLQRFPIDVIKVDKSFVDALGKGPQEAALARGVFLLARTLGATTVAEGIESAGQRADLLAMGCSLGQGYYFARPLTGEAFETLLAQRGRAGVNRPASVATRPRR